MLFRFYALVLYIIPQKSGKLAIEFTAYRTIIYCLLLETILQVIRILSCCPDIGDIQGVIFYIVYDL